MVLVFPMMIEEIGEPAGEVVATEILRCPAMRSRKRLREDVRP